MIDVECLEIWETQLADRMVDDLATGALEKTSYTGEF